jgi:hypothetical protein
MRSHADCRLGSVDRTVGQSAIRNRQSVIAAALVPVLALWWWPGGLELIITPRDGGDPILALPLEPGERFTLQYVHSVDRAPIWEEHCVDQNGNIYVEEERFVMFGAGMGHWPGHGTLTRRGPHQVIENIHKPVGEFVLRVGSSGVDHTIIWRGKRVNLSHLAAGRAVVVSARPLGPLERLWPRWRADCGRKDE